MTTPQVPAGFEYELPQAEREFLQGARYTLPIEGSLSIAMRVHKTLREQPDLIDRALGMPSNCPYRNERQCDLTRLSCNEDHRSCTPYSIAVSKHAPL